MVSSRADALARRAMKPVLWLAALAPLALIVLDGTRDALGADPIEEVTHRTGKTALILLLCTLAVTPARKLTGWNPLVQLRRPLGLFVFFYGMLHFSIYLVDQSFDPAFIVEDVVEHPYVTAGFAALLLMVPLAATSTKGWIRRLGKRWVSLHRLVYVVGILAIAHFVWLVKKDVTEPLTYGAVLAILLVLRLPLGRSRAGTRAPRAPRGETPAAAEA
jgi:sulfoxide reductase heme-binding subunit YedZ